VPGDAKWSWLETSKFGGQDGSLLAKLFKGKENLTAEELLAREAVQNSWDAARTQQEDHGIDELRVRFRFVELIHDSKMHFVRASGLDELQLRRALIPVESGLDDVQVFRELRDPETPLRLLYVEDFGTHGLFGDPERLKSRSHLFKAMYLVGGSDKSDVRSAQGGSYGFGKGALARASGTNTVFAHSAFGELNDDPVTRRLVGWTWWPGHTDGDKTFEGRAIFGRESQEQISPLTDEDADRLADELGIQLRDPDDPKGRGTTFLLVDPVVEPQALRQAIEVHWWPALEEHLIDVSVVDFDGSELTPRPSKVNWLVPYLEAFRIASGSSPVVDQTMQKRPSDKWRALRGDGVLPGDLGLVVSQAEMPDNLSGPTVALIRSPRMVIEYRSFLRRSMPIYGAYIASSEADPYLRLTEPPAHDLWETKPRTDTPGEATRVAKSVLDRVKKAVTEFAEDFQPPTSREGQRLDLMENVLSSLIRKKSVSPSRNHPVAIRFVTPENVVVTRGGLIRIEASIRIEWSGEFQGEGIHVSIDCRVSISEDDSGRGERWASHLTLKTRNLDFRLMEDGSWSGFLPKGASLDFDLKTDPFDAEWTAVLYPRVQILDIGEVEQ